MSKVIKPFDVIDHPDEFGAGRPSSMLQAL